MDLCPLVTAALALPVSVRSVRTRTCDEKDALEVDMSFRIATLKVCRLTVVALTHRGVCTASSPRPADGFVRWAFRFM
jgi:hypothetical protein